MPFASEAAWSFATNPNGSSAVFHPAAPNPTYNFAQPYTGYAMQRDRVAADLNWKINDIFTWRSSYAYSMAVFRDNIFANNTASLANGTYSQIISHNTNFNYFANSGYSFVDASFNTWFVHNKVTTGFYGNDYRQTNAPTSYASSTYSNFNFSSPTYVSQPSFAASGIGPVRTSTYNTAKNVMLGDDIEFNKYVSALVGGNYAMLSARNFSTTNGSLTSSYDQGRLSPSASLIIKPLSWLSTYGTYSESLQPGQVVQNGSGIIYTNNGQTLAPFVGREYEIGAKANVGGMLLTASLFQLTQALQYSSQEQQPHLYLRTKWPGTRPRRRAYCKKNYL